MTPEEIRKVVADQTVMICVPWAHRSDTIKTVQRECHFCGRTVACEEKNAPVADARGALYCCIPCVMRAELPLEEIAVKGMVGGVELEVHEALTVCEAYFTEKKADA